jgi:hypothetical protein
MCSVKRVLLHDYCFSHLKSGLYEKRTICLWDKVLSVVWGWVISIFGELFGDIACNLTIDVPNFDLWFLSSLGIMTSIEK